MLLLYRRKASKSAKDHKTSALMTRQSRFYLFSVFNVMISSQLTGPLSLHPLGSNCYVVGSTHASCFGRQRLKLRPRYPKNQKVWSKQKPNNYSTCVSSQWRKVDLMLKRVYFFTVHWFGLITAGASHAVSCASRLVLQNTSAVHDRNGAKSALLNKIRRDLFT